MEHAMTWLDFREPASAWTHALGFLLAIPATWVLLHVSRGDRLKQTAFLVFGSTLFLCYLGSTLYHAVRLSPDSIADFATLDHIGIYLLIAGTITPAAAVVLRGWWRGAILLLAWSFAICGITLRLSFGNFSPLLTTAMYLAMGWGVLLCYFELARSLSHRAMLVALLGGLLYTVGALCNVARWPNPLPGVFGPHEVFHLFVLAGSLTHFLFMLLVLVPFVREPHVGLQPQPALPSPAV
jgi:hemolysin III